MGSPSCAGPDRAKTSAAPVRGVAGRYGATATAGRTLANRPHLQKHCEDNMETPVGVYTNQAVSTRRILPRPSTCAFGLPRTKGRDECKEWRASPYVVL